MLPSPRQVLAVSVMTNMCTEHDTFSRVDAFAPQTEKYYASIMADLLTSLTSTLWRVRESSCSALCDLIRQHSVVPAVAHLQTLWTTLFRVRDDIKESVREAANKTLQSLSKSCIKVGVALLPTSYLSTKYGLVLILLAVRISLHVYY